jgi:hypothetical protein
LPGPTVHYDRHKKRLQHAPRGTSRQRARRHHKQQVSLPTLPHLKRIPHQPSQQSTYRPRQRHLPKSTTEGLTRAGVEPVKPLPRTRFQAPTETTGGPLDLVSTLTRLDPSGGLVRDLLGQQATSDVGAVKESWQEALGHNLGGLKPLPSGRQAGAAVDIAALTSLATAAGREIGGDAAQALGDLGKSPPTLRGLAGRGLSKVEPQASKAVRGAVTRRAAGVAGKVPGPVQTAGKVGLRVGSLPARRPFSTPLAVEVLPAATGHGSLKDALEGKGTFAALSAGAAGKVGAALPGEAGKLAQEAINVPAAILPTTYLTGKAGVEAAEGNPAELEKLWEQYKKTGFLPAIFEGRAGQAFKERPIWSLLEASGAKAALGRGLGIGARAISHNKIGGVARPDLEVPGYPNLRVPRKYSRDLLRQGVQRLYDRRTGSKVDLSTRRGRAKAEKIAGEMGDWLVTKGEQTRRLHQQQDARGLRKALPKQYGRFLDRTTGEIVPEVVQRLVRSPETFMQDLPKIRSILNEAYQSGRLDKVEAKQNRAAVRRIDNALKKGRVEGAVASANEFIKLQQPILDDMIRLKLITPERAALASAIPFARIHMGAGHGLSNDAQLAIDAVRNTMKQSGLSSQERGFFLGQLNKLTSKGQHELLDAQGNALPLEQVTAEMQRHGIEPPGWITHRQPTSGDFYQRGFPAPRLGVRPEARTGASALAGTHVGGIEGLYRSIRQSHGLVDRVENWNEFIDQGIEVKGVTNMADAARMARDPERYGLPPDVVPVRRWPFIADSDQITTALQHQDPLKAEDAAEGLVHSALKTDKQGNLSGSAIDASGPDSPIVFMHKDLVQRYAQHNEPISPAMRRIQAGSQAFKRAVLPFSPSFYYGNAIDNTIRTALAGINPAHFLIGFKYGVKYLTEEEKNQILSGNFYGSVPRLSVHRSADALFRGNKAWEGAMRAVSEWSHSQDLGVAGRATRGTVLAPFRAVSELSKGLMATNSALTEVFPQYGAVGKLLLADSHELQGSWAKALLHLDKAAQEWAKGVKDPATMLRIRKDIEETYGNWTRMSPNARQFWSNVAPFWTWMRAALKFAYVTMPAHHPIQTGIFAGAERATEPQREKLGLSRIGKEPLPGWLQGGLPLPSGISPWAKYQSFGYAGSPIENVPRTILPYLTGSLENLQGVNWKGESITGGELANLKTAAGSLLESFMPGFNLVKGLAEKGPEYLSPLRSYPKSTTEFLRRPKKQIQVPEKGSGKNGSGTDYSKYLGGGGGSGTDYSKYLGGR